MLRLHPFLSESYHQLPLKRMRTGHLCLQLQINGFSGRFLVDSGASKSCISFLLQEAFQLTTNAPAIAAAGAGKDKLHAQPTKASNIQFKKIPLGRLSFLLLDMEAINATLIEEGEQPIDGILGADFLRKKSAVITYKPNRLYLKQ